MATYIITTSNWNSAAFWSGITETGTGHTLDFSALDATYSVTIDQTTGVIWIDNGATAFTIGEAGVTGVSANFGGSTLLDYFTTISGAQSGDRVTGSAENEVLDGNTGGDRMEGMGGDDTLYGNGGMDQMDGGDGADLLYGGADADFLYGGAGADQVFGETGNDTIDAGTGDDFARGGAGADLIYGGDGADHLEGGWEDDASDTIFGDAGNDLVFSYGGGDSVFGGTGNDWMDGGAGDDYIEGNEDNDRILGDLGDDRLTGDAGYDILSGGEGADGIDGGNDADSIWGNGGDTIYGGEGGDDNDTLYVDARFVSSISYSTAESGTVTFNDGSILQFFQIENVVQQAMDGIVDGTAGDDQIGQFYFDADGDWVDNGDAIGQGDGDSVHAGAGNDTIWSNDGNDTLHGEAGDDLINTGSGENVVFGGSGADTINGEFENDTISGDDFVASGPNLIVNGSFEDTTGMNVDTWGYFGPGGTAPGWTDLNGYNIEFHSDNRGGLTPTDGTYWLDLEADPGQNSAVSQTVAGVQDGQVYVLTFDAADLANGNDLTTLDNQMQVIWNGDVVGTIDTVDGAWRSYEFHLIGGSGNGSNTLTFAGLGDASGIGVSLDNVQMHAAAEASVGDDSIDAWDGDDDIMTGAGNDTILAGGGNDEVVAGSGNDSVLGGSGDDTIHGDGIDTGGSSTPTQAIGQWLFDNGAEPTDDTAALDNDALLRNGAAFNSGTGAIDLDGVNDFIEIADQPAYDLSSATITMGFILDTLSSRAGLFSKDANGNALGDFSVYAEADGRIVVRWQDDTNSYFIQTGAGTVQSGVDYDLNLVLNSETETIEIYVNGTLEAGGSVPGVTLEGNVNPWIVGASGWGSTRGTANSIDVEMDGSVSYFEIYGGAFTPTELAETGTFNDTIDGGDGADLIFGEIGDDSILGGAGNDTIWAEDGNDTLIGGDGNDSMVAGTGNDILDGGTGNDTMIGGLGQDTLIGSVGADFLQGNQDSDLVDYSASDAAVTIVLDGGGAAGFAAGGHAENDTIVGIDEILGSAFNDSLTGYDATHHGTLSNIIDGGTGDDTIDGMGGNDILYGGTGNDSIAGGAGDDFIDGGDGDDSLTTGAGTDTVFGGAGNDTIRNGEGDDSLVGGTGDDLIIASAGNDTLEGGDGNDTLDGGIDNDSMSGGADADTFIVNDGFGNDTIAGGETVTTGVDFDTIDLSAVTTSVTVNFSAGEAGTIDDDASTDVITFTEVERLILTDQADVVNGGGGNEVIDAGGGDDTVATGTGNDSIFGGAGNDSLIGGDGNDTVDGGAGDDYVAAFTGDDLLLGGDGNDEIFSLGGGNDTLDGGADADLISVMTMSTTTVTGGEAVTTGTDNDTLNASTGVDMTLTITGAESGTITAAADTISYSEIEAVRLGSGNDTVEAGTETAGLNIDAGGGDDLFNAASTTGNNTLEGQAGNDTIYGGSGDETLGGGSGNDQIFGGAGNDSIRSGGDADTVEGGLGNDTIDGAQGDDLLDGGDGADLIFGGDGADTIIGGVGNDTLAGGGDADTFVFTDGFGNDTIVGGDTFTTGANYDTIDLTAVSNAVSVVFSGQGAGTITDSVTGHVVTFSGIEQLILTQGDDTVDATLDDGYTYIQTRGGNDYVQGSPANDVYDDEIFGPNGSGNDTFIGGDGADQLWGGTDQDSLVGGLGDDSLYGQSGNDTLDGGAGNDVLEGGIGDDSVTGGDGADLITEYSYGGTVVADGATVTGTNSSDAFVFAGAAGTSATIILDDGSGTANDADVEYDTVFVTSTGDAASLTLEGFSYGTDRIQVSEPWAGLASSEIASGHHQVTVTYANGNTQTFDVLHNNGTDFDPALVMFTYAGNDTLDGGAGNDTILAAYGNDSISGGTGDDQITAGEGSDTIGLGDNHGADTIVGGEDPDGTDRDWLDIYENGTGQGATVLYTGNEAGTVEFDGTPGVVSTFSEIEVMDGTNQADLINASVTTNGVEVYSNWGDDTVIGGSGADTIYGGLGADSLEGGGGADTLTGQQGNDTLLGGAGNDTLTGNEGADSLEGQDGDDLLIGDGPASTTGGQFGIFALASAGTTDILVNGTFAFDSTAASTNVQVTDDETAFEDLNTSSGSTLDAGALQVLTADITIGSTTYLAGTSIHAIAQSDIVNETTGETGNAWLIQLGPTLTGNFYWSFDIAVNNGDQITWTSSNTPGVQDQVYANTTGLEYIDLVQADGQFLPSNDTLVGGFGNDTLIGGVGDDSLVAGDGADSISGDGGSDWIDAGTGNDTVDAGDGNDQVFGWTGDDSVLGGDGNDTVFGQDGNDTIFGGAGNDSLDGDDGLAGADSIFGEDGDDTIIGDGGNDTLSGGSGNDLIFAGADNDSVTGGIGNDQLYGEGGDDFLDAGAGDDTIIGDAGNDTIIGFEGNDSVLGGAGDDVINTRTSPGTGLPDEGYGAPGNPLYYPADTDAFNDRDTVDGGIGNDSILTGDDNDVILGGDGADTVDAGFDDDEVFGDAGADSLEGNEGNDTIFGGADNDVIYGDVSPTNPDYPFYAPYELANDGTDLAPDNNSDLLMGDGGNDTIYGQDDNDSLYGGDGNDLLDGGIDNDLLDGQAGSDTLLGGAGNDTLFGGSDTSADSLDGGDGNDSLSGGGGDDIVEGGLGDDWLSGNSGNDTVRGGDGADSVFGAEGDDVMYGDAGNDSMEGWLGNDTMFGGTGDDYLDGASGADSLEGGDGNDTLLGGSDIGNDTLRGGAGDDSLSAGGGDDVLDGGDGADFLYAADGNDQLDGGVGNDTLDGWSGNDTLTGGTGDDQLTGGTGNDTFVYVAGDGTDTITDFNFGNSGTLNDGDFTNNDRIDLSAFYDDIWELTADFNDDGVLNQSNSTLLGGTVDYSNNASFGGGGVAFTNGVGDTSFFTVENTGVVCFASGTRILTEAGERPIETLRIGDRIITRDNGVQTLRWIGHRHIGTADLLRNPKLRPILLSPDLTGGDAPLIVSPQHGVLFDLDGDETLVRATHLAKMQGGAARVMKGCRHVTYFHLLFEDHQIVFANGAPSESFFPGSFAMAALNTDAQSEIFELFPELRSRTAEHAYGAKARNFARSAHLPDHLKALKARKRRHCVPGLALAARGHMSGGVSLHRAVS